MLLERNLGLALLGAGLASAGCVTALPAQKPNDTYTTMDPRVILDAGADAGVADGGVDGGDAGPRVGEDEANFLEDLTKELAKQGWTPATPGEYEMQAASIVARAAYEQRWSSSGVKSSPPNTTSEKPLKSFFPTTAPLLPVAQYATAYGIVPGFTFASRLEDYAAGRLSSTELEDLVRNTINPRGYVGKARIGVATLPDSADAHRIFTAVIRDQCAEISEGAPRVTKPGTSFSLRGTMVTKDLSALKLMVLEPDGKVTVSPLTVGEGGFEVTYTLPEAPGIYVVSLTGSTAYYVHTFYQVAVFSGVEPSPWPPRPPEDAPPAGDPKDAAMKVVAALENWRVQHGLPILPVRADLCAAAKAEAQWLGAFEVKNKGGPYDYKAVGLQSDRLKAAGIDPARTSVGNMTWWDAQFPYALARFLENPNNIHRLTWPKAEALGIGVTYLPKEKPEDQTFFRIVWMVSNSEPTGTTPAPEATPPPAEPAKPIPPTPPNPDDKANARVPEPGQPPLEAPPASPTPVVAPPPTPPTAPAK